MGASFAAALRTRRPDIEVVGSDRDPVVVVTALERGLIAQPNVDGADVLFVCVPPGAMQAVLRQLPRGVLISDMASTKVSVCEWASEAGLDFVGGHPMCGREQVGIQAADPGLFEGAPWILTTESSAIEELVRAVGARPVVMDP
ncbi:MAG: prephenate dehydrogenase/arogenate dehydrogenase family protein, partial [Candidatus Dormibacteraeota bacterium]|nr:prephenate dehydrogenase/arogenate dehydrogenase family protein [Candidatus Dormibacteraeota bacterium]